MIEDIGIIQLWDWAIENSPSEYIVWVALAVVVGIAFRVVKPVLDWIASHIGMVFRFVADQIGAIVRFFAERSDKRREFRKANKMPNRT